MASEWWYASGGQRQGPVAWDELQSLAAAGRLRADDAVWNEGMADWQPARTVPGLYPGTAAVPPLLSPELRREVQNKKLVAGLCGILVGGLGIHKFVLGLTTPGIVMLVITVATIIGSCVTWGVGAIAMQIIGLIEGILYLTKSDEEFYRTYMVEKREWF